MHTEWRVLSGCDNSLVIFLLAQLRRNGSEWEINHILLLNWLANLYTLISTQQLLTSYNSHSITFILSIFLLTPNTNIKMFNLKMYRNRKYVIHIYYNRLIIIDLVLSNMQLQTRIHLWAVAVRTIWQAVIPLRSLRQITGYSTPKLHSW